MTGNDRKVLPQCAAQLAVLEATGKQMNKAFGSMQQEFKTMSSNMQTQQIAIGKLTGNVDRLANTIERLSDSLDKKIDDGIKDHEKGCVLYQAAKKKAERDITKRLRLADSLPPSGPTRDSDAELGKEVKKISKKVKYIVYVIAGVGTIVGTIASYLNF